MRPSPIMPSCIGVSVAILISSALGSAPSARRGARANTAAPTMPASFCKEAATTGVRNSMKGRILLALLLTPPPMTMSEGQRMRSTSSRYAWSRSAYSSKRAPPAP